MTPDWKAENRALTRMAIPTILSTLTVPLVSLTDAAVVGHLPGAWPLAAVAMGGAVYGFVMTVLYPFRGLSIALTGRWMGEGRDEDAIDWTLWGLAIATVVGGAIALSGPLLAPLALGVFHAEGPARAAFLQYLTLRLWEVPFVVAQLFLLGHLRGAQRAWGPSAVTIAVAILNAALNVALVFGAGLGVAGSALASVAANAAGAVLAFGLWWAAVRPTLDGGRTWANRRLLGALREAFGWGVARSMLLMGALALFAAAASHLGAEAVAAHAILMQLWLLSSYAIDGFACGMEAIVARRWGQNDRAGLRAIALLGLTWCVGIGLAFTAAYMVASGPLVALFTGEVGVRSLAVGAMIAVAVLQPVVAVAYWADGILTAVVDLKGAFMTLVAGAVACALVLPWSRQYGLLGIWLGLSAFSFARSLWSLKTCQPYLRAVAAPPPSPHAQ